MSQHFTHTANHLAANGQWGRAMEHRKQCESVWLGREWMSMTQGNWRWGMKKGGKSGNRKAPRFVCEYSMCESMHVLYHGNIAKWGEWKAKRKKSANENPLIRTRQQQQLSRESEEQQKDVTGNYCEHGSIQYKYPCVLLRRRITLKIHCHLILCHSVKNKHRGNILFFLFTAQLSCPVGR